MSPAKVKQSPKTGGSETPRCNSPRGPEFLFSDGRTDLTTSPAKTGSSPNLPMDMQLPKAARPPPKAKRIRKKSFVDQKDSSKASGTPAAAPDKDDLFELPGCEAEGDPVETASTKTKTVRGKRPVRPSSLAKVPKRDYPNTTEYEGRHRVAPPRLQSDGVVRPPEPRPLFKRGRVGNTKQPQESRSEAPGAPTTPIEVTDSDDSTSLSSPPAATARPTETSSYAPSTAAHQQPCPRVALMPQRNIRDIIPFSGNTSYGTELGGRSGEGESDHEDSPDKDQDHRLPRAALDQNGLLLGSQSSSNSEPEIKLFDESEPTLPKLSQPHPFDQRIKLESLPNLARQRPVPSDSPNDRPFTPRKRKAPPIDAKYTPPIRSRKVIAASSSSHGSLSDLPVIQGGRIKDGTERARAGDPPRPPDLTARESQDKPNRKMTHPAAPSSLSTTMESTDPSYAPGDPVVDTTFLRSLFAGDPEPTQPSVRGMKAGNVREGAAKASRVSDLQERLHRRFMEEQTVQQRSPARSSEDTRFLPGRGRPTERVFTDEVRNHEAFPPSPARTGSVYVTLGEKIGKITHTILRYLQSKECALYDVVADYESGEASIERMTRLHQEERQNLWKSCGAHWKTFAGTCHKAEGELNNILNHIAAVDLGSMADNVKNHTRETLVTLRTSGMEYGV